MKVYYYGEPSLALVKAANAAKAKAAWLRFPAAAIMLVIWAILMPPAWLLIKAGDIGHNIAGWCGFYSRDWE